MAKNVTIPVRLDPAQTEAIRKCAERFGVTDATVIRWAVDALIRYVQIHGGDLHLPIDFTKFWQQIEAAKPPISLRVADEPDAEDSQEGKTRRTDVQFEPKKRAEG